MDKNKLIEWEERTGLMDFQEKIKELDLDKFQKERLTDLINKWVLDEFVNVSQGEWWKKLKQLNLWDYGNI